MDFSEAGLRPNTKLFINENLARYNQKLLWKYKELKRAGLIISTWSLKDAVKLRRNQSKKPVLNEHNMDMSALYSDFTSSQVFFSVILITSNGEPLSYSFFPFLFHFSADINAN